MHKEFIEKARQKYQDAVDGKENHWLDPGEYEYLVEQWFKEFGLKLLEMAESLERENAK